MFQINQFLLTVKIIRWPQISLLHDTNCIMLCLYETNACRTYPAIDSAHKNLTKPLKWSYTLENRNFSEIPEFPKIEAVQSLNLP